MRSKLIPLLDRIVGTTCWHVACGGCTGSMFNLHFEKQLRADPLKSLSDDSPMKNYQGKYRIFVQDAHWELFENYKRVAYDESDSSIGGELMIGLNKLAGKKLMHYVADNHCNLVLYFEDYLLLRIFSLRKSLKIDYDMSIYSIVANEDRVEVK